MKKEQSRKPSRLEQVADTTKRHFSHQNSAVIHAKQELLMFENAQIETSIAHLQAALEAKKDRRNVIGATLAGLAEVLSCR